MNANQGGLRVLHIVKKKSPYIEISVGTKIKWLKRRCDQIKYKFKKQKKNSIKIFCYRIAK